MAPAASAHDLGSLKCSGWALQQVRKEGGKEKKRRGRQASFTEHNVFKMHLPVVCFGTLFLFMAELYSIYGWITFYLSIHLLEDS